MLVFGVFGVFECFEGFEGFDYLVFEWYDSYVSRHDSYHLRLDGGTRILINSHPSRLLLQCYTIHPFGPLRCTAPNESQSNRNGENAKSFVHHCQDFPQYDNSTPLRLSPPLFTPPPHP